MKKFKYIISSLITVASLISCNNYLDVNENPNAIHAENITPELLFPGAVSNAYRVQAGDMMQFGNLMMNSWAGDVYHYGGLYPNEFSLSAVNSQFYDGIWDGIYLNVNNFVAIENYPNTDHRQDKYIAMAKVMKAFYMQYIVDLYGDAPFRDAFKGQNNLAPKYDNDVDIYRTLITNLDEAVALITLNDPDAIAPAGKDIVFAGDMNKWKSFAYTLKLRFLLRMSNVTGDLANYRNTQLASLSAAVGTSGSGFISNDVLENPGYSTSTNDKMNPFFLGYFYNSAGNEVQNHIVITASENLAIALNGNIGGNTTAEYQKFNGLTDPRRFRLFTSVTYNGVPQVKGVRQGATSGQPGAPTDNQNVSKLAIGNVVGSTAVGSIAQLLAVGGTRSGVIMSLAEAKFLLAEASLRYPSLFTSGQAAFNAGVLASGVWVGANSASMNTYITQTATRPGLGWVGTDAQKLEAIMTQKWIALTNVNPTEMYVEYNRTNLPYNPVAVSAVKTRRPYRLVYPNSEYATNSANVPNISSDAVFTKNQYTPFWNQN
jgi:hypothetical protein